MKIISQTTLIEFDWACLVTCLKATAVTRPVIYSLTAALLSFRRFGWWIIYCSRLQSRCSSMPLWGAEVIVIDSLLSSAREVQSRMACCYAALVNTLSSDWNASKVQTQHVIAWRSRQVSRDRRKKETRNKEKWQQALEGSRGRKKKTSAGETTD